MARFSSLEDVRGSFLRLALPAATLLLPCAGLALPTAASAQSTNPGDPQFCRPQEGVVFLIVNGGSRVFTVDPDCCSTDIKNDTQTTITTSSIQVTTVRNSAGGEGSIGGTVRPGGPATLGAKLNVLPATAAMTAAGVA